MAPRISRINTNISREKRGGEGGERKKGKGRDE